MLNNKSAQKGSVIVVVLVVLAALVLGSLGTYWCTSKATKNLPVPTAQTETSTWKTYTSPLKENGLVKVSIKYPIEWKQYDIRIGNPFAPGYGFKIDGEGLTGNIDLIMFEPVIQSSNEKYIQDTKSYLSDYKATTFLGRPAVIGLYPWSKEAEQIEEIFFVEGTQGYMLQIRYKDSHKDIQSLPKMEPNILQTLEILDTSINQ